MAIAMSNYIHDLSNLTVGGDVGNTVAYVQVVWPWITLPAILVLSGVGSLILAIIKTKQHALHAWKTSELALLFHGLERPRDGLAELSEVGNTEEVAHGMRVRMVNPTDREWVLRKDGP